MMGPDAVILVFWMLSFKPTFSLSFLYNFYFCMFRIYIVCNLIMYYLDFYAYNQYSETYI